MKPVTMLLLLLFANHFGRSQQIAQLTDSTIVRDSAGKTYSYGAWRKMLSSWNYGVIPTEPSKINSEYLIIHLTEEQKEQMSRQMPKPRESEFFKTGKEISNFKATDINGNKINIKELKGKIVVLNFWFINCPPCRKEIPELNEMVNDYKDSTNIVFLGVANDYKEELQEFLKNNPFDYTIIDNGRYIAGKYSIRSFPTNVILDKAGHVYFHSSGLGAWTVTWLRKSIEELLANNY